MIHDNPHHYLERNAEEIGNFLERQLSVHRARVRKRLAVASGLIGLVAVGGLTVLYMLTGGEGNLPDGVKKANVIRESEPKSKALTPDDLAAMWDSNSAHLALLEEIDELEDPREIRSALAGFPFADVRPDIYTMNTEISALIRAITRSAAAEHRTRVEDWLESSHTDRRVKKLARKCLGVLDTARDGAEDGAGPAEH